ncbi:MAG: UDP-N-acetylmuramate--L-alanine ligase [Eubacterium sp.]|nr:UDP-N-acetylmuramate--L-alanine ligase [Eubacterium sp.]
MYTVDFKNPCHVHFIGIGGTSMSGLARFLQQRGFTVTGSDSVPSKYCDRLMKEGITVYPEHSVANMENNPDIAFVVYTAAISEDNPEFTYALSHDIPVLSRAQLLGQMMDQYTYGVAVAGTHGKTTTTAMMSHILMAAKKDPTITLGGDLELIGGNFHIGSSEYFVAEACEYTNSYHEFRPWVSIILNIDSDHLDFFHNLENIIESFATFGTKVKPGGYLVVNGDMPYTERMREAVKDRDIHFITFGLGENCDYRAVNIREDEGVHPTYTLVRNGEELGDITLSVVGEHHILNSLSAVAASDKMGISMDAIQEGLRTCKSAHRRFEFKGVTKNGVTIIDDYGHHPLEAEVTIRAARKIVKGELWVAFQSHTHSRTKALLNEFADALALADHALVADIRDDREADDGTVSARDIVDKVLERGTDAVYLGDFATIEKYISEHAKNNDLLITLGSGPIGIIGENLLRG